MDTSCFYLLAVMNNASMKHYCTDVQISFWIPVFNCVYAEVELLGHTKILLNFWEIIVLFSTVATPFYIPTSNVQGVKFLHILDNIVIFNVLDNGHPNRCEVVSHFSCCYTFAVYIFHWFFLHSLQYSTKIVLSFISLTILGILTMLSV